MKSIHGLFFSPLLPSVKCFSSEKDTLFENHLLPVCDTTGSQTHP